MPTFPWKKKKKKSREHRNKTLFKTFTHTLYSYFTLLWWNDGENLLVYPSDIQNSDGFRHITSITLGIFFTKQGIFSNPYCVFIHISFTVSIWRVLSSTTVCLMLQNSPWLVYTVLRRVNYLTCKLTYWSRAHGLCFQTFCEHKGHIPNTGSVFLEEIIAVLNPNSLRTEQNAHKMISRDSRNSSMLISETFQGPVQFCHKFLLVVMI